MTLDEPLTGFDEIVRAAADGRAVRILDGAGPLGLRPRSRQAIEEGIEVN